MSTEQTLASQEHIVLAAQEGEHFSFLNHLATIKVRAGDHRSMSVVEFVGPRGFGPPLHSHTEEDELFVIFDGELEFHTGDQTIVGGPGSYTYLPRAVPHTFQILTETARFMNVTASTTTIPRFDQMVAALGEPVADPSLPEPGYIDPVRVADVCRDLGIDIVGPPPAPIT
jgi:quercetin dioxygenase-like cupin family protein